MGSDDDHLDPCALRATDPACDISTGAEYGAAILAELVVGPLEHRVVLAIGHPHGGAVTLPEP